jgi:acyl-CoA synthetase (AMP-forming)/AMP-acid ligase II
MAFQFADLFEAAVDAAPDRLALVCGAARRTYAELDRRANRAAHALAALGIGPGDHVGIHGWNCAEWVETMLGLHKIRAVPVNVNYRYVEAELAYLFGNADLRAVVVQRRFASRVAAVRHRLPLLEHVVVIDDGSGEPVDGLDGHHDFEALLARASDGRAFPARSADDVHIIYTGGTTGLPKGVMWRHEDLFFALAGGIDAYTNEKVRDPGELARRIADGAAPMVFATAAPLMHGAGQVGTLRALVSGDTMVLLERFDPEELWRTVAAERAQTVMVTGDAMARPLADALVRLRDELDLSSLLVLSSTAAIFSPAIKEQLMELLPNLIVVDSVGATETGMNGIKVAERGEPHPGGPARVNASADTIVVDDDLRPVAPGSGVIGRIARTGNVPLGYYKDPERSAQTFIEHEGRRYAIAGDFARVEADGQITLLGRGSIVINTGGEKVFPEEVEGVLKAHPDVFDALVVGVPDDRWGERVTAVVAPRPGAAPTLEALAEHCRARLAAYKAPKQLVLVPEIVRAPSGKPDYPWAKRTAAEAAAVAG